MKEILILFRLIYDGKVNKLFYIMIISFLASIIEITSIIVTYPFISGLLNGSSSEAKPIIIMGIQIGERKYVTWLFFATLLVSPFVRYFMQAFIINFGHYTANRLAHRLYFANIGKRISDDIKLNSSDVTAAILTKTQTVTHSAIIPSAVLISNSILILAVSFALFAVSVSATITIFFSLLVVLGLLFFTILPKLKRISVTIDQCADKSARIINEGFAERRTIHLNALQEVVSNSFFKIDKDLRNALAFLQRISIFPRYFVEAFIFSILGLFIIFSNNPLELLPLLATFALAGQKMMPIGQQVFSALTSIRGSSDSVLGVIDLLNQKPTIIKNHKPIEKIKSSFELKDISIKYGNSEIQSGINMKVYPGQVIGIIGESGVGKSSLLDILLGLRSPSQGRMYVNEKQINNTYSKHWFRKITYIPQNPYLLDDTIFKNINLFSETTERTEKYKKALSIAQCCSFIEKLPSGDKYVVGENSTLISGGQKQRLSMARALNREFEILIMDEPTSALDQNIEKRIFDELIRYYKDKIIIFTTHKPALLSYCDQVIELKAVK